jgi:pyridinium-3,5-biscarboxylic acid mononucleotide sulfurtransferase
VTISEMITLRAGEGWTVERAVAVVSASLKEVQRLGVAFSGGVDSSLLVALAARAIGADKVVALLGVSPSLAAEERSAAHAVAGQIGVRLIEVSTYEGDRPEYQANGPDRCFYCKDELFSRIEDGIADRYGLDAIAYGENADDARRPDRPGARAASNHNVLRPLADAGMTKLAVRTLAKELGLQVADKPAAPCLASRIPHHHVVTPAKLSQIERAESALRQLGFAELRVRHHDDIARIELPLSDLIRAVSDPLRTKVLEAVRSAGFRFVAIDVAGIQSGAFTLPLLDSDHACISDHA